MVIPNKYNIGDIVYLVTDPDQNERMVIGINIRQGAILYLLAFGPIESFHYEIEISPRIDHLKKFSA
jgi:hypothetical protein